MDFFALMLILLLVLATAGLIFYSVYRIVTGTHTHAH